MLIPLLLFCISTCITPGSNNFMIMASGTNFGVRRSLPHFMGICIGFPAMLLVVGLGLASVFSA
jgi:threonine/homoserine/homoserine lactone efflux protein